MMIYPVAPYEPVDTLYLWWLEQPDQPRLIGELAMARSVKGVSLTYADAWLKAGFPLSEDLPLRSGEFLPREKESAAGAVDDARPDRWGERIIRFLDKPKRLAVLDYLYYAGHERFGALGVSLSGDHYVPQRVGPLPSLGDVADIDTLIQRILAGEKLDERQRRLIAPGVTFGGARPKALIAIDGDQWVVKFAEPDEPWDTPLIEHATMTLCATAGIHAAQTRAIRLPDGHAVAIKRFDRQGTRRVHALSAHVALRAVGAVMGYAELAQLLRRRAVQAPAQMRELFRRMVFNILIDNTDDHEKNHVLLGLPDGGLALSPAFDVLPSGQALGYQQMRVGADGHDATLVNALSEVRHFALSDDEARQEVALVARAVDGWQAHFRSHGVSERDIESLSAQIDRPALRDQRRAFIGA